MEKIINDQLEGDFWFWHFWPPINFPVDKRPSGRYTTYAKTTRPSGRALRKDGSQAHEATPVLSMYYRSRWDSNPRGHLWHAAL